MPEAIPEDIVAAAALASDTASVPRGTVADTSTKEGAAEMPDKSKARAGKWREPVHA
jgi:hypothetical protein